VCAWTKLLDHTVGPVNIRTCASDFWVEQIHQTWVANPKKMYIKRVNIEMS
jgi:hypothetical protein